MRMRAVSIAIPFIIYHRDYKLALELISEAMYSNTIFYSELQLARYSLQRVNKFRK